MLGFLLLPAVVPPESLSEAARKESYDINHSKPILSRQLMKPITDRLTMETLRESF